MSRKFKGVITPVVTPLLSDFSLDKHGLNNVIEHLISGGVHGLFILGTTGQGPHLSHKFRKEVILETVKISNGRLPVIVGVTDTSIEALLDMCSFAKDNGVAAVVMAAPFYVPASQEQLSHWMNYVIPRISIPILLYDLPSHINVKLSVDVVKQLSEFDHVIGIKDSSGNMSFFNLLLAKINRTDFGFYTGPELLFGESLLAGGDGGVPGGSNLYPKLFVEMYNAAVEQNMEMVADRQKAVRALYTELYQLSETGSGFMCGLHAALGVKGICNNIMLPPYISYQDEDRIKEVLEDLENRFPFITD